MASLLPSVFADRANYLPAPSPPHPPEQWEVVDRIGWQQRQGSHCRKMAVQWEVTFTSRWELLRQEGGHGQCGLHQALFGIGSRHTRSPHRSAGWRWHDPLPQPHGPSGTAAFFLQPLGAHPQGSLSAKAGGPHCTESKVTDPPPGWPGRSPAVPRRGPRESKLSLASHTEVSLLQK